MAAKAEVLAAYLYEEIQADLDWEELAYGKKMYWLRIAAAGLKAAGIDYEAEVDYEYSVQYTFYDGSVGVLDFWTPYLEHAEDNVAWGKEQYGPAANNFKVIKRRKAGKDEDI